MVITPTVTMARIRYQVEPEIAATPFERLKALLMDLPLRSDLRTHFAMGLGLLLCVFLVGHGIEDKQRDRLANKTEEVNVSIYLGDDLGPNPYLVTVEAGDRAGEARSILYRHGGFDRTGWDAVRADRTNILGDGSFRAEDGRTIQLKEEQLRARKTPVKAGEVEIRKEVHTDRKTIQVPVEREEVVIERRPAGGRAAAGNLKSEQIRIPVKEEKVNVSKETVVKEEVNVGKRKVRDTQSVSGDVRREAPEAFRGPGVPVRHTPAATVPRGGHPENGI